MAVSLNTARLLVASLLNASGWTNVSDANITSGAAVLSTTANAFASTDIGKTVYILGAGFGGATLSTRITAYTSATQVTVADNASTTVSSAVASFGGDVNDDRRNVPELDETILAIDLEVCRTILENPKHPQWGFFGSITTVTSPTSPVQVSANPGSIRMVQRIRSDNVTVSARRVPFRTLQQWAVNAGNQFATANIKENFYALYNGHLYFAGGGSITFKYVSLSKLTTCQAPDDHTLTVAHGTLATLLPKEGDAITEAASYQKLYEGALRAIGQVTDLSEAA